MVPAVRLPRPSIRPSTVFYLAVAVLATAPAWIVEHPPLQDYPFHFATLRLIHSIHDPAFGFSEVYRLAFVVRPATIAWACLTVIAATVLSGLIVRGHLDRLDLVGVLKTPE